MHAAGHLGGIGGAATVLTVAVVVSGFVGRYVYTAVPRTLTGSEATLRELEDRVEASDAELRQAGTDGMGRALVGVAEAAPRGGWGAVLWRPLRRARLRRRLVEFVRSTAAPAEPLVDALVERYGLLLQADGLARARRLFSWWHAVHVPLGGAVFASAAVHVAGAIYYGMLTTW